MPSSQFDVDTDSIPLRTVRATEGRLQLSKNAGVGASRVDELEAEVAL